MAAESLFGKTEDDEEALRAAREAVTSGNEEFRRKALQLIKADDVQALDEFDTYQNLDAEVDRLAAYWATSQAKDAHGRWDLKRQKGSGKAGRRIQEFLTSFKGFLGVYSGIVEVIKVPGIPFGNVAYGTLSLLLNCATNKTENESKITSALEKMKNMFPRMDFLAEIYRTKRMKGFVSEVYLAVIEFARAAVFYFHTSGTTQRIMTALFKPPELGDIDHIVDKVLKGLAEVHTESNTLLHGKLQKIEQRSKDLVEGNQRLEKQNEELISSIERMQSDAATEQAQSAQQRLEKLRGILGEGEGLRDEANIDRSAEILEREFGTGKKKFKAVADMYKQKREFCDWESCSHSCLLLFHGLTMIEGRSGPNTYSWLSPATICIAKTLPKKTDCVAYYCCHPKPNFDWEIPVLDVLSNLICQILEWNPSLLPKREYQRLKKLKVEDFDDMSAVFHKLLILAAAGNPVYIVLDRLDKCDKRKYSLLQRLAEVVHDAKEANCPVKILVVVESPFWDADRRVCDNLREDTTGCIMSVWDWRQPKA